MGELGAHVFASSPGVTWQSLGGLLRLEFVPLSNESHELFPRRCRSRAQEAVGRDLDTEIPHSTALSPKPYALNPTP